MDVVIVCHTEFGKVMEHEVVATKDQPGATTGVLVLDNIARKYGARVTYMVCPEVAGVFPDVPGEIGLHIHPGWEPSHKRGVDYLLGDRLLVESGLPSYSSALRDYTLSDQTSMINVGRQIVTEARGVAPKAFLSGCWSVNNDTVTALESLGFTHDCSGFPGARWDRCDWSRVRKNEGPYHPSREDYQVRGDSPLLMVPTTQMIRGGCINPENARIYSPAWLKLNFLWRFMRRDPLMHICVHSPAMLDPFLSNAMDSLLKTISVVGKDIRFLTVSEVKEYV